MTDNKELKDTHKVSKIRSDIVLEEEAEYTPPVDEELVKSISFLLDKAKKGEIQAIAWIDYWAHGGIGHGWDGVFDSPSQALGEMEVMKYNYLITSHGSAYIAVVEDE